MQVAKHNCLASVARSSGGHSSFRTRIAASHWRRSPFTAAPVGCGINGRSASFPKASQVAKVDTRTRGASQRWRGLLGSGSLALNSPHLFGQCNLPQRLGACFGGFHHRQIQPCLAFCPKTVIHLPCFVNPLFPSFPPPPTFPHPHTLCHAPAVHYFLSGMCMVHVFHFSP